MGAKGTVIIFGGGVYVAENTSREASVELAAFGGQPRRRAKRRSPSAALAAGWTLSVGKGRPRPFPTGSSSVYPDDLPQRALAVHALVDAAHDAAHGGGDVLRPGDGHVHQRGTAVGERVVAVHD